MSRSPKRRSPSRATTAAATVKWIVIAGAGAVFLFLAYELGRRSPSGDGGEEAGSSPPGLATSLAPAPDPSVADPVTKATSGGFLEAPRLAIVVDDLGRSLEVLDELAALEVDLSYAVLPFETRTASVAAHLREHDREILCHLPMQGQSAANPGPGALTLAMTPRELRRTTRAALDAVPGAIGVNNHMGSMLSADRGAMTAVLEVLARRGLFFLDSRTSAETLGFELAQELEIEAAERQVFLDRDREPAAIAEQFERLLDLAAEDGAAIAIGHPYPETLEMLRREVPRARELGFVFVRVSALVSADPGLAAE